MPKRKKTATKLRPYENIAGTLLLIVGTLFLIVWVAHKFLYFRSIALSVRHTELFTSVSAPVAYPSEIQVGDRIRLAITPAGYVNGTWLISDINANHVTRSASPGEPGNIIIYAHNKPTLFGPLDRVQTGEHITIKTKEGKEHTYRVAQIYTVSPSDTTHLLPAPFEVLTLYTCTGFLDSKRLIIRAVPLAQ